MTGVTDTIALTGLRARGRHGVYDFERDQGQDFVVDVVLELDLAPAASSDDVADTVHYGELADRLVAMVAGEPVNLIETLADRLARRLPGRPRGSTRPPSPCTSRRRRSRIAFADVAVDPAARARPAGDAGPCCRSAATSATGSATCARRWPASPTRCWSRLRRLRDAAVGRSGPAGVPQRGGAGRRRRAGRATGCDRAQALERAAGRRARSRTAGSARARSMST